MLSGRFLGRAGDRQLEVRLDVGVPGGLDRVSGDLFAEARGGLFEHLAHFLSPPLDPAVTEPIETDLAVNHTDTWRGGRLAAHLQADGSLQVELLLDRVDAAPADRLSLNAARVGPDLRALRIRPFVTPGVEAPESPRLAEVHSPAEAGQTTGPRVSFVGSLAQAGFGVALQPAELLAETGGDDIWTDAELHDALAALVAQAPPEAGPGRMWDRPLLVVPRTERPFVVGITFETGEPELGRVCAVFFDGIRRHENVADDAVALAREYLFTCVHETAHVLGLPHVWEPLDGIGEPARGSLSLTFTNYPHLYRLGGYPGFYRRFRFRFQNEELLQLRHGPWPEVFPGTSDGHSEIDFLLAPDGRAAPHPGLELELRAAAGGSFAFAQPVQLEAKLVNRSGGRIRVPQDALDLEGGRLEVYVARSGRPDRPRRFLPLVERRRAGPRITLGVRGRDGEPSYAIYETLDLSYGRLGFPFSEPGPYTVRAAVLLEDGRAVRSPETEIRVREPHRRDDEDAAAKVLLPGVGCAMALGGDPDGDALATLREVVETGRPAGLVSWAAYRLAESLSREFKRPLRKTRRLIEADPAKALGLLALVKGVERWPNQLRSRALQLRARCSSLLGRREDAEQALRDLRNLIEGTAASNRPLRAKLLQQVSSLRRKLRGIGVERSPYPANDL